MVAAREPYQLPMGDQNLLPDPAGVELLARDQVVEAADTYAELSGRFLAVIE